MDQVVEVYDIRCVNLDHGPIPCDRVGHVVVPKVFVCSFRVEVTRCSALSPLVPSEAEFTRAGTEDLDDVTRKPREVSGSQGPVEVRLKYCSSWRFQRDTQHGRYRGSTDQLG